MIGWTLRHLLAAVLAVAVDRDQLHRAGAVQGVGGDQVFDAVGLHLHQQVLHAAGLELEDALGLAAAEEVEHVLVGQVDLLDVDPALLVQRRGGLVGRPLDRAGRGCGVRARSSG